MTEQTKPTRQPLNVPWTKTPYDKGVSPNPANREEFIRTLISHIELLTDRLMDLEEMATMATFVVSPNVSLEEPEEPKPKQSKAPAAKGGGGKK